jgi:hypothetical protein
VTAARRVLVGLSLDGIGADAGAVGVAELVDAATRVETLGFDFLSLSDPIARARDGAPRLSAVDALAFLARRTRSVGLLAGASSHYAEPFHVSKALATLDFISAGRAGLIVDPGRSAIADGFFPAARDLGETERGEEALEFIDVVADLWDSWEDGAEIRERATGRYVDSAKIHHIDHDGPYFRVKGPLITPRPPQGRPPVLLLQPDGAARLVGPSHVDGSDDAALLTRVEVYSAEEIGVAIAAVATERAGSSGALLLQFAAPPSRLAAVLAQLAEAPFELPGLAASAGLTLSERLGLPRRPSRFAESA